MDTSVRSSSKNNSTTGTAVSVSAPTGTTTGDAVLIFIHVDTNTTIVDNNGSTPFTEDVDDYAPNNPATYGHTVSFFYRRIQAGDPSTYNFTSGTSGRWSIIAIALQNPNPYTILDATTTKDHLDSDSSTATAPSITTKTYNAIHFTMGALDDGTASYTGTPAGYTATQNTANQPQGVAYKVIATPAATGTTAHTFDLTSATIALSVAVRNYRAVAPPTSIASAKITTDGTTATISGISRTAGRLYLLFVASKTEITANPNQPTASGTGVSFTVPSNGSVVYDNTSSSRRRVTGMYAIASSSSSADITIDYSGQTQVTQIYDLLEITDGFNATTPVPQAAQNSSPTSSVASITATLSTLIDAYSIEVGGFGSGNGSDTYTVGTGFTLLNNQQDTVEGNITLLTEYKMTNDTTVDVSASPSQSEIGIVAMEIAVAVTASTQVVSWRRMRGVGY